MWLKVVKIIAQVAIQTGAAAWAKEWLKKRLQKQLEAAKKKAEDAVATAEANGIQGVYGVTVNRKRAKKEEPAQ